MKVLMINKFLYPNGGSETYIFKIGDYLKSIGHEVQYFGMEHEGRCVGNEAGAYTSDMDFHGGSALSKLTYPVKTIYSAEARKKIRLVLDDFQPDVCHLNNFNYQLTPSVILEIEKWKRESGRACRIIFTAHDYQLICPNHMLMNPNSGTICEKCIGRHFSNCLSSKCIHGSTAKSAVGMMEAEIWNHTNVYSKIDTFICCSEFMKSRMDTNPKFAGKTIALHNFIDRLDTDGMADDSALSKDLPEKYVLYFGRFSEEKGIKTLLKAVRRLPDVQFVFAGTGPLQDETLSVPNIMNVGFQTGKALSDLISGARFSVYPSEWYENCPFSVMESQMCGTPVLASRIGGIPELIKENETGELFEAGSTAELTAKINRLWEDDSLIDRYTENCRHVCFDSTAEYCDKLLRIYMGEPVLQSGDVKTNIQKEGGSAMADTDKKALIDKISKKIPGGEKASALLDRVSGGEKTAVKKLNGTVIVTYRCNARCNMCNRYKKPSRVEEEISIETIKKLPPMYFTNITGGEPFIRTDLKDIVRELRKKSDRIVISTNGFFTDRIIDLCKEFPDIGIRISIEGLEETNNAIRGLPDGFNRGYTTLKKLRKMGMKDVGFGMTVQDANCMDLVRLYRISNRLGMEFATASLHNSFYFVEAKNIIHDRPKVAKQFERLVNELLNSNSPKKWFRAYFNHGLINYIYGQKRLLPCDMSFDTFFIDPYGDVMPCNGTKDKEVMGNLNEQTWDELWNSPEAEIVRKKVRNCDRDCWMIGSVSPAMHRYIWKPALWVIRHKFLRFFRKKKYSMYELKVVRDYRDGKLTKEDLDKCSTCDMCAVINDGLSETSKQQLVGRSGEDIVDADIASQMSGSGTAERSRTMMNRFEMR
ncbi:MAG: glycosyltransferase [Lachnospiraceae bacterium]|nr:glycosyltransferase [Lachnospiraceae bacterium]